MISKHKGFAQFQRKLDGTEPKSFLYDYSEVSCCSLTYLKLVLEGNTGMLSGAFIWNTSIQGPFHWNAVYRGDRTLSSDDLEYLEGLLEYSEGLRE